MNWKTTITIIFLWVTCISASSAQSALSVTDYRGLFKEEAVQQDYSLSIDMSNEFKMLLTGGFSLYKKFISSQDAVHCAFHPSCSVYALETIKTNGLLGVLDAIDRLTRCNGFSPQKYIMHNESQLFYDPVSKIH